MDEAERIQLARRLSALSWNQARKEIYRLDRRADMKYYRNARWNEYHTLFTLPTLGVAITLVEVKIAEPSSKPDYSGPTGSKRLSASYKYTEARVEPLDRPANRRGGEQRYQYR